MKQVTRFQTIDGQLHESERAAKRYADCQYSEAVSRIAAQLVKVDKFQAMKDFVDCHLLEFVSLRALKADIEIVEEED